MENSSYGSTNLMPMIVALFPFTYFIFKAVLFYILQLICLLIYYPLDTYSYKRYFNNNIQNKYKS